MKKWSKEVSINLHNRLQTGQIFLWRTNYIDKAETRTLSTLAFLTVILRLLKFWFGLCEDGHYVNYRPVESIYC